MNKKLLSSLLAATMVCSTVMATDFRAPLPGRWGSLRYDFDKIEKGKSAFNVWSTGYMREADKAFMKHGFDSHPYTSLIFGKEKFKVADAFQDATDDYGLTQNQNPNLSTASIAPRVSYTERGIVLGAQWTYPVWSNKGRIGLRGSIPLRNVRMEKDNESEATAVGDQRKVFTGEVRNVELGDAGHSARFTMTNISSYNLKYLANIKTLDGSGRVVGLYQVTPGTNFNPRVGGQPYPNHAGIATTGNTAGAVFAPMLVIKATGAGQPPLGQGGGVLMDNPVANRDVAAAPGANSSIAYVDASGTDYRSSAADIAAAPGTNRAGFGADNAITAMTQIQANWGGNPGTGAALLLQSDANAYPVATIPEDLWVTTIHGQNGAPIDASLNAKNFIDNTLAYYNENLSTWLTKRGFAFETYELTGLGDADLDVFYNHHFSDSWNGELFAGVRLPTGSGDKYYGNPYRMFLGNGDHFEIKVGGKIAWATCNWLHLKAQAQYNFALEATEHRMAAFKGATIKNLGPKADADVSWGYFVGDIDVTLFHPKTSTLATTIGYELYYKTEDSISFKNKTMTDHWLGDRWVAADGTTVATATTAGTQFKPFSMELDNKVARKDTESIGHRVYVEGNYDFSKYLRVFLGGKYTFAGQNIPVETEGYGGLNVKF